MGRTGDHVPLGVGIFSCESHSAATMEPVVTVDALWKSFRSVVALENLTLEVPDGSMYLLLGPNGSGKTTLLRILAGALLPTEGTVRVLGEDPYRHLDRKAREVGIAYESHYLPPWASASVYLRFAARIKGLGGDAVDSVTMRFGLQPYLSRDMGTYSAGMRKRVMLAQAWLGDPRLLVLDEPLSNLDPEGRRLVARLLLVRASEGKTTMVATHLVEPGITPSHLAVLLNGRLAIQGALAAIGEQYGAATVTIATPDQAAVVRLFLEKGIDSITTSREGLLVHGSVANLPTLISSLRERGIDARLAGESYDIWEIYRAVLLGEEQRSGFSAPLAAK